MFYWALNTSLHFMTIQFLILKQLGYCFQEPIGFDLKTLFLRRSVSRLIKPDDIIEEF